MIRQRLRFMFILTFYLIFIINIGSVSASSEITVCESGCDNVTIQDAIDSAGAGDIILVKDGTYIESVKVNKPHLTIKSENGVHRTVVQSMNTNEPVFEVTADYVYLSGFTVRVGNDGVWINSSNNIITSNTVADNTHGIFLFNSSNNTLINNYVINNYVGVGLSFAFNNTLINNTANFNTGDGLGIAFVSSSNNTLINNTANFNDGIGIRLEGSSNNLLTNNNASQNSVIGIDISSRSINNTITSNTANSNGGEGGNTGINLYNSSDNTLINNTANFNEFRGIYLSHSSNNILASNEVSNNGIGVTLVYSDSNTINGNNIIDNFNNLDLYFSNNNLIIYNTIDTPIDTNWEHLIYLSFSNNNEIYLNNLITNAINNVYSYSSINIWNSPEPITYIYNGIIFTNYTGNYWDDYTDDDENNDGIWDNPYTIDSNNQDDYPLKEGFENYLTLGDQAASFAESVVGASYLWGGKGWDYSEEKFVDGSDIKSGYFYWNPTVEKKDWGQGLDCSGLSFWSYNKASSATKFQDYLNPILYEGANGQWTDNLRLEQNINKEDLKRGDLLFLIEDGEAKHVIMYVGNGLVVHAEGVLFKEIVKEELSVVEERYQNYGYTIGYGKVKSISEHQKSTTFKSGDYVKIIADGGWNLRNESKLGEEYILVPPSPLPKDSEGQIQDHDDNGIPVDGYYWWYVKFGVYEGWCAEDGLSKRDSFNTFPELFIYGTQKNDNLYGALFSISQEFKINSVDMTPNLLAAVMATLEKEVGNDFLPIEENGDFGMGGGCLKTDGSCCIGSECCSQGYPPNKSKIYYVDVSAKIITTNVLDTCFRQYENQ